MKQGYNMGKGDKHIRNVQEQKKIKWKKWYTKNLKVARHYYVHSDISRYSRYGSSRAHRLALLGFFSWWRYQMETFSALLVICEGNSPVPVTRSFGVFFDLRLNKRLSKQSWGWWFETLSRPLWRHCYSVYLLFIFILFYFIFIFFSLEVCVCVGCGWVGVGVGVGGVGGGVGGVGGWGVGVGVGGFGKTRQQDSRTSSTPFHITHQKVLMWLRSSSV